MKIYLVGGAVRDELLGLNPHDKDWVVTGKSPEEMLTKGFKQIGRAFPVFLHPTTKEEYALARTEKSSHKGHTGFVVNFDASIRLEEDLLRRDLTINAIAKDTSGRYIDPFGGIKDLIHRQFRHVSEAFLDDPLRLLRLARFASADWASLFTIHPKTLVLLRKMSAQGDLLTLSSERIWMEIFRALENKFPHRFFEVLYASRGLHTLMPELLPIFKKRNLRKFIQYGFTIFPDNLRRYAQIGYWCRHHSNGTIDCNDFNAFQTRIGAPKLFRHFGTWLFIAPPFPINLLLQNSATFWFPKFQEWGCWRQPEYLMIFLDLLIWREELSPHSTVDERERLRRSFKEIRTQFEKILRIQLSSDEIIMTPPKERQNALKKKRMAVWEQLCREE